MRLSLIGQMIKGNYPMGNKWGPFLFSGTLDLSHFRAAHSARSSSCKNT